MRRRRRAAARAIRCACARARIARVLGVDVPDARDRRDLRRGSGSRRSARRRRLHRHAAQLSLRPRDRGRPDRGSRARPRLRRHPGRRRRRTARDAARAARAHASAGELRHALVDRGYQEVINYSFVDSGVGARFRGERRRRSRCQPDREPHDVMRTTLLGGLVEALRSNLNRKPNACACSRSAAASGATRERLRAAGAHRRPRLRRRRAASNGAAASGAVDFFDVKGDVEALAGPLAVRFDRRGSTPRCTPGARRACSSAAAAAGWVGELHPRLQQHSSCRARRSSSSWTWTLLATRPLPRGTGRLPAAGGAPGPRRRGRRECARAGGRWRRCGAVKPRPRRADRAVRRVPRQRASSRAKKALPFGYLCKILTDFDRRRSRAAVSGSAARASTNDSKPSCAQWKTKMTLTKAELADLLFEKVGLNKREAKDMVESFFEEIRIALERARASSSRVSAISSCARSRSGRDAIRRPARKFPSPRGASSPFTRARS